MQIIRTLLILLACTSLLIPTAALAECVCCAQGGCGEQQSCCENQRGDSSCCEKSQKLPSDVTVRRLCCFSAPASESSPVGDTGCDCCFETSPVVPARTSSTQEVDLELAGLHALSVLDVFPDTGAARPFELPANDVLGSSPLRIHALFGVWLN